MRGEVLPNRSAVRLGDPGSERGNRRGDLAELLLGIGIFAFLAAALEAALSSKMVERTPKLIGLKRAAKALCAECVGIQCLDQLLLRGVGRHQASDDQRRHEPLSSLQEAITPPPCLSGLSPLGGVRGQRLWMATVRKDP